jgi:hypothetical protein
MLYNKKGKGRDLIMNGFKDLIVWQKSMDLTVEIYNLTKYFPKEEFYALTN